ncbi:hypothetical protein D3C80_1599100 [compost metagenome]
MRNEPIDFIHTELASFYQLFDSFRHLADGPAVYLSAILHKVSVCGNRMSVDGGGQIASIEQMPAASVCRGGSS